MHTRLRSVSVILTLFLLSCLMLTGCVCSHEWQESTCLAPRTCTKCGETEGKLRAHKWGNTACNATEPCTVCGTLEGIVLTHEWREDGKVCIHCGLDERPADIRFMDLLSQGLEERFLLMAQDKTTAKEDQNFVIGKEQWVKYIDAEYTRLADFRNEKFQDKDLEVLAKTYVNRIIDAHEALSTFGTEEWDEKYTRSIYPAQLQTLFLINAMQSVEIAEEYQPKMNRLLVDGEVINLVSPLFDQILFLNVDTNGDKEFYETTVTNSSTLTFKYFTFEIDLLDKDGNCIATETSTAENWKPDQKIRFNFSTTEKFHAMRTDSAEWELADKHK